MNCLWCWEEMDNHITWSNFLTLKKPGQLCETCSSQLLKLKGKRCSICSRESSLAMCSDCKQWQREQVPDVLTFNHSIFHYNAFMKEVIAKWKYRGDYVLGELFRPFMRAAWNKLPIDGKHDLLIVPIPLSEERLYHRSFNQAELLASFLTSSLETSLVRIDGEKQAKKNRQARIQARNPFTLTKTVKKPVLLVDDIYTTGTTLRHAAQTLQAKGCPQVYALTLIRG